MYNARPPPRPPCSALSPMWLQFGTSGSIFYLLRDIRSGPGLWNLSGTAAGNLEYSISRSPGPRFWRSRSLTHRQTRSRRRDSRGSSAQRASRSVYENPPFEFRFVELVSDRVSGSARGENFRRSSGHRPSAFG